MRIVIIGLGTAAFAAILAIRKLDRTSDITVIDKKHFDLQHSCGLPYVLEGKFPVEKLEHSIGADMMKVNIFHNSDAIKIISGSKEVEYSKDNIISKIRYDRLLLDTGSLPYTPLIDGIEENQNVYKLKSTEDVKNILNAIKKAKSAAVIGAGAIGIETAYALSKRGLNVTIIEALSCLFPRAIDADMSTVLEEYLKQTGITVLLNQKIKKIHGKKIICDKEIDADIIISAVGVRPNIKLAFDAGIKTSKFGLIVDENMETSIQDIYAAGDCVEAINLINSQKFESQLATTAYKQGTVAGENISGKPSRYKGSISTFASVIGNMEIACTGLNSFYAKEAGIDFVIGKSTSSDKPEWFSPEEKITLKILANKGTGKIIGCQAIGKNAFLSVNIVSTAISAGMVLKDLSNVELAYCPAVSQTYGVLHQAVDLAIRKI
jgi:NADH oxidase (H2O2-forming)